MSNLDLDLDLDRGRRAKALRNWLEKSRKDMTEKHRYPEIDFDSNTWALRSKYKTKMADINLSPLLEGLAHLDSTYSQAIRCVAGECAIADSTKSIGHLFRGWRLMARGLPHSLLDLRRSDLQRLEQTLIDDCKAQPQSADATLAGMKTLARFVDRIERAGVVQSISWTPAHDTLRTLKELQAQHARRFKKEKTSILDRQIEALSDAMGAMFRADERLTDFDRAALAAMGVLMCAPSRINEPLCMAIDDVVTIEDYGQVPNDQRESERGRMQALLLQKGSKGAGWTAKPALTFMLGLLTLCIRILREGGKRSRALASWYEQNPKKLYLPTALEDYRGKAITRRTLWQIVNLSDRQPTHAEASSIQPIWNELSTTGKIRAISNPNLLCSDRKKFSKRTLQATAWDDLEPILLRRVHETLEATRRVTHGNPYKGQLSKMLMLFDTSETPYLPGSIKYQSLHLRFKQTHKYKEGLFKEKKLLNPTVFEKLNLTMVVNGKVEYAWIETHDPRRWLTTQALLARERLSDVLINKWANRLNIEQLRHYDLRSDTQKANQATMPVPEELGDLSAGLQSIEGIEAEYGLKTEIIVADQARVSVTSMAAIASATEDRPVARTSSQIIILYPSRFGVCLHQHHETPCRAFNCAPCSENLVVKGHLPTNDEIRKRNELLTRSILSQVEQLVTAHTRKIADSPEGLEAHLLTLVRKGLTAEEMSEELIRHFHEIKDRIKSVRLRNELEEAFVARGMVQRLDDPNVASGALMRYHNPARHASPGHERALEAHGGRAEMDSRLEHFHRDHPEFAPTHLGLKDQRDLLEPDEEDDDDE
ncbi:hypothetical protein [Paraburkholderia youngii]|uniref:Integrase n=1 Tax=Paraburkholderia youngii TaxID=2782701 RepID=A0A7W8LCG1_9BURK|nr:hypothetical protein [Paraburkholderia youngii]MBB5404465.1 hypothetical protein [Paraburkholderia youngii]